MPRTHYQTDLSVGPPLEISQYAVEQIPFTYDPEDSGLSAVTATCVLRDLGSGLDVEIDEDDDPIITTPDEDVSVVTIDADALGLARGQSYELLVVFTLDNDTTDEGSLILKVVA
jgi:hypothetical protein